jgi:hypothetical protein
VLVIVARTEIFSNFRLRPIFEFYNLPCTGTDHGIPLDFLDSIRACNSFSFASFFFSFDHQEISIVYCNQQHNHSLRSVRSTRTS